MFKKIAIVLVVIVAAFLAVAALQPADFRITRAASMAAPPETVFPHVNDMHQWQEWSPWAKVDPSAKISFDGPPSGKGAGYAWDGNMEVGAGRMTVTESQPSELIRFQLDFEKPMKGTNLAEFTFKPEGGQTVVTWSMSGKNGFMGKAVGLIMNCDKMVGGQFEKGLSQLNEVVKNSIWYSLIYRSWPEWPEMAVAGSARPPRYFARNCSTRE